MHFFHTITLLSAVGSTVHAQLLNIPQIQQIVDQTLETFNQYVDFQNTAPKSSAATTSAPARVNIAAANTCDDYWMQSARHQGIAAFNSNPSGYQVFRNVKDFGAKGDGVTDDTQAINNAISSGNRCAPGRCASTTVTPAVVYFPAGTYMVSASIIDYYYTQMIGNPKSGCMPTIRATSTFSGGLGVIDGDQYGANGLGYGATNVFWRQIRNLIIDTTLVPAGNAITGIHWPTAQATSLQNIVFNMNANSGTQHQGIFIEEGSGGFMNDLTFNGGLYGANWGNQQFTVRNLTFNRCVTAINQIWDWGWTYQNIKINSCTTGINMTSSGANGLNVGSVTIVDSTFSNTPVGILTARTDSTSPVAAGALIIENTRFNNVNVAVRGPEGTRVGRVSSIAGYIDGHAYTPTGPKKVRQSLTPNVRPSALLVGDGSYYQRSKPQYENLPYSSFVSARTAGARGDGRTDDTTALQNAINSAKSQGKVLFIDHGTYRVTSTIYIPAGSKIVGESYPVIMSSGSFFNDINSPQPVVQVGKSGETGSVEWSDCIVSTQGQQRGATLIQYNLIAPSGTPSGLWDVHVRIGGFAGSNLLVANCPKTPGTQITPSNLNQNCISGYLSMHLTPGSTGLYLENVWVWVADHDIEDPSLTQITIYAGRGLLDQSAGPVWMVGTAVEHHVRYEYQFAYARNVYAGQIQTETAYYQPNPNARNPFPTNKALYDPSFNDATIVDGGVTIPAADGWGLRIVNSTDILVYGAGLYSFFNNYSTQCSNAGSGSVCQNRIASIEGSNTRTSIYNLNTIGARYALALDGKNIGYYNNNQAGFEQGIALFRNQGSV